MLNQRTSANVQAWMTIEDIAPAGFQLSQFSTDAGIVADANQEVQADMTLDGELVTAYTPSPVVVNITLMPTSPAIPYLRQLLQAQRSENCTFEINLTVTTTKPARTYRFTEGAITSSTAMPGMNRVQDPLTFQITFARVE